MYLYPEKQLREFAALYSRDAAAVSQQRVRKRNRVSLDRNIKYYLLKLMFSILYKEFYPNVLLISTAWIHQHEPKAQYLFVEHREDMSDNDINERNSVSRLDARCAPYNNGRDPLLHGSVEGPGMSSMETVSSSRSYNVSFKGNSNFSRKSGERADGEPVGCRHKNRIENKMRLSAATTFEDLTQMTLKDNLYKLTTENR